MPDLITVTIESLGARGDGIGHIDDKPVYVPMALPGEIVQVYVVESRKSGIYGQLKDVVAASPERRDPPCQHFGRCGGCSLQHLENAFYRKWLADRVGFALAQQSLTDVEIKPAFVTSESSRRRVALKALRTGSGLVLGFNAAGSHQIIDLAACPVMAAEIWQLLPQVKTVLESTLPDRALATVHITQTATGMDVLIDVNHELSLQNREQCSEFAEENDLAALHWQNNGFLDPVAIRREPVMVFGGARVPLPPGSFIQAASDSEAAMVEHVLAACDGLGRVADLFCGLGTFTFPLAKDHQVLAVEGAQDPLRALESSARNTAPAMGVKLKQVVTKHRDLFRRPLTAKELSGFEGVVIDPPRAGAQAQMTQLAQSTVQTIASVSCNPNTFARDAKILVDGGYEFVSVLPVDQFLWSTHLELIGIFRRP